MLPLQQHSDLLLSNLPAALRAGQDVLAQDNRLLLVDLRVQLGGAGALDPLTGCQHALLIGRQLIGCSLAGGVPHEAEEENEGDGDATDGDGRSPATVVDPCADVASALAPCCWTMPRSPRSARPSPTLTVVAPERAPRLSTKVSTRWAAWTASASWSTPSRRICCRRGLSQISGDTACCSKVAFATGSASKTSLSLDRRAAYASFTA